MNAEVSDFIILDGRASYDPDGKIAAYNLEKITGPENYGLNTDNDKAYLSWLIPGTYIFTLTVVDNYGASVLDTIIVKGVAQPRPVIRMHLEPLGRLSMEGSYLKAVSADSKIFFTERSSSTRVDIYNVASNTWSIAEIDKNLSGTAIISVGNKIYLAGGPFLYDQVMTLEV